jgi:phosphohistidine phosphatase SixA
MTLYLVRHASAGARGGFGNTLEEDLARRLDPDGEEQAISLIDFLGERGVTHVYSSSAIRCVQTVEPLAQHLHLDVEAHPALMEGQSNTRAIHLLRTLASTGATAVLCSHGDIIPDSIQTLAREGMIIVGPRAWAKGSTWELRTRGGDITEAEFLGPY